MLKRLCFLILIVLKINDVFAFIHIHPGKNSAQSMLPVGVNTSSEIDEAYFTSKVFEVYNLYFQDMKNEGRKFKIFLDWKNPYFSAWSSFKENSYYINFWGGMARIPGVLYETWDFIACHEVGHVLGQYPRIALEHLDWATSEAQSDHFATSECLPRLYKRNLEALTDDIFAKAMPYEIEACLDQYPSEKNQKLCLKILRAGRGFVALLKHLNFTDGNISYETPAKKTQMLIDKSYPSAQCRLDIFFRGAMCLKKEVCPRNNCWYLSSGP
ncbi:MAG: hypothetical protein QF441_11015 [Bacteriovoracaceae bacterium]|jgi:hypothetical protein|nr:hypothetical protein [Bacteriovoracaceae bacterium]|tara:strand:- start:1905 stop:2714 length:810 start_codon:yes stop_codon:yes gene_type:complete